MSWCCTLPRRECVLLAISLSFDVFRDSGLDDADSFLAGPVPACDDARAGNDDRPLFGVPGASVAATGTCADKREGTLDPPLSVRFIGCAPTKLAAFDCGSGEDVFDDLLPIRRICARTCDNWRSYSHAACCKRNACVTLNRAERSRQSISWPFDDFERTSQSSRSLAADQATGGGSMNSPLAKGSLMKIVKWSS